MGSEREGRKGLCLSEHWGFVLPPQFFSPTKLISLMQLNSCIFISGFSVGFYYEHHQSLPQEQSWRLLGLAVTQSQQCWCISLHSTHSTAHSQPCPKEIHSLGHPNAQVQAVSTGFSPPFAFSVSDHRQESPAARSCLRLCSCARVKEQPLPFQPQLL